MSRRGASLVCLAVAASTAGLAFVPVAQRAVGISSGAGSQQASLQGASAAAPQGGSSSTMIAGLVIGAHLGVALSLRTGVARRAEKAAASASYVESAQDKKLFEDVFKAYTMEYLKGPMYVDERKDMKAFEPGMPIWDENKKLTSNILGPWKRVSSNELAFVTMVSLVIGLWGYLQFNYFDPQFPKVDAGEPFNPVYIIAFLGLPLSFVSHLACYIQKTNGK
mmetsp:Transcript_14691/g.34645  ORF Transcript_14691/g.34645 Transcript_14691/m.34645 type:complete len:222 (+) Transcript_14691:94-759(+)